MQQQQRLAERITHGDADEVRGVSDGKAFDASAVKLETWSRYRNLATVTMRETSNEPRY